MIGAYIYLRMLFYYQFICLALDIVSFRLMQNSIVYHSSGILIPTLSSYDCL